MKDKKDMLMKELNELQEERIQLQMDKQELENEIKGQNDKVDSFKLRIKMYERSTEEQKRDLDKAMILIQEKNEKIKEVLTEY